MILIVSLVFGELSNVSFLFFSTTNKSRDRRGVFDPHYVVENLECQWGAG